MVASRSISLSLCNPVGELSDGELCIALAREAMGWKRIRQESGGRVVGDHPCLMTAFPMTVPDWTNNPTELSKIEFVVKRKVGLNAYRD